MWVQWFLNFSCKTNSANLTFYGSVGCPFPDLENMWRIMFNRYYTYFYAELSLCIGAQRKIVWYRCMSPISMFHILSRPVYKLQKQTLWRCCLPTTFHCLRARREHVKKSNKAARWCIWNDWTQQIKQTIYMMWDSTHNAILTHFFRLVASGWKWCDPTLRLDPNVQVTLARFAGDVDKCLEFLLDTEEGHFLGLTGQWSILSGRYKAN